jgi:hypothetical protein
MLDPTVTRLMEKSKFLILLSPICIISLGGRLVKQPPDSRGARAAGSNPLVLVTDPPGLLALSSSMSGCPRFAEHRQPTMGTIRVGIPCSDSQLDSMWQAPVLRLDCVVAQ